MRGKRGFGTLFITVILFSLLMAFGVAIITNLVTKQVKAEVSCEGVSIKLEEVQRRAKDAIICYKVSLTTSEVGFKVVNNGERDLDGVIVNVAGEKGIQKFEVRENLKVGEFLDTDVKYNRLKNGEIEEVVFIPTLPRSKTGCFENIVTSNDLGLC